MSKLKLVLGLVVGLGVLALFAVVGALSFSVTGFILGGGGYLVGFWSAGTAQTIVLAFAGLGAVIGGIKGMVVFIGSAAS